MYTILEKIRNDATISSVICDAQRRKFIKLMLFIGCVFFIAILFAIVLKFQWIGWIVAIVSAVLLSAFAACHYKLSKPSFLVGKIQNIEHDYRVVPTKGTAGFKWVRGNMKNIHTLNIGVLTCENENEKVYSITCPSQYKRLLGIGDTILHHPYLKYPATLSHKTKCICMNCGTMQSTDKIVCFECQTTLFHFNAFYQSTKNNNAEQGRKDDETYEI